MNAIGLYVHIPFCQQKCVYCDFNSYAGQESLFQPYLASLRSEFDLLPADGPFSFVTLFIGGGTPTVLPARDLAALISDLRQAARLAPDAEISIEANPGTVDAPSLERLRAVGVNRLSLGVQSLDDGLLRLLGRIHTADQARQAVRQARAVGFDNLSLDLMLGLPGQSLRQWQDSVWQALELEPEHLSMYALTVEMATPLARQIERGTMPPPDDDLAADMYGWAEEALGQAGYGHYEVSNWALPGRQCHHNLIYWRNQPYIGLGAGAHSWWAGSRRANLELPADYVRVVGEGRLPIADEQAIDRSLEMGETMMMGLRLLDEGVSMERFRRRFGLSLEQVYAAEIAELEQRDLIELSDTRIRLTAGGHLLGNQVFSLFV